MNFKSIKKKHFQLFYKFWRFTIKGLQPWDQWATCDPEPNASLIFFFKTKYCTSLVGIVIKNKQIRKKMSMKLSFLHWVETVEITKRSEIGFAFWLPMKNLTQTISRKNYNVSSSKLRATFCTFYLHLRHMGDTAKKKISVEHFSCVICFVPPNLYCCAELGLLSSNTIWIITWACWGWMMLVSCVSLVFFYLSKLSSKQGNAIQIFIMFVEKYLFTLTVEWRRKTKMRKLRGKGVVAIVC